MSETKICHVTWKCKQDLTHSNERTCDIMLITLGNNNQLFSHDCTIYHSNISIFYTVIQSVLTEECHGLSLINNRKKGSGC